MIIVKRINNNAVLCVDVAGHQVVALGRGLADAKTGTELNLERVDRTFYDVDPRYLDLVRDLPLEYLEISVQIANTARSLLPYELSPNIEVALADHLQFAVQRMHEHIAISAPLVYDLQQNYPLEYKIAEYTLRLLSDQLGEKLPRTEAQGIAMCLINGAYSSTGTANNTSTPEEDILEQIVSVVEETVGVTVDRNGFGFARFATHVQYLLKRMTAGETISTENSGMYNMAVANNERISTCINAIAALLKRIYLHDLTEEERLYLVLHINRICTRAETRKD